MKDDRFGFEPGIIKALQDIESIPQTEPGAVPGIPGRLFIIAPEQKEQLEHIVKVLDNVTREELSSMSDKEKMFYSGLLNNADTVLKNSIGRLERKELLKEFKQSLQ